MHGKPTLKESAPPADQKGIDFERHHLEVEAELTAQSKKWNRGFEQDFAQTYSFSFSRDRSDRSNTTYWVFDIYSGTDGRSYSRARRPNDVEQELIAAIFAMKDFLNQC